MYTNLNFEIILLLLGFTMSISGGFSIASHSEGKGSDEGSPFHLDRG